MITAKSLAAHAIAALVLIAIGAACAWIWQDNAWSTRLADEKQTNSDTLETIATAAAEQLRKEQAKRVALEQRLLVIDEKRYKELNDVKAENKRLAADLRNADHGLSVRTSGPVCINGVPATPSTAGVDDGTGARAELHPATAAGLVGVTGRADECRVRLEALQEWVRAGAETKGPR